MPKVEKTRVPRPEDAKSEEDHFAFAQHMLEQRNAGHYKIQIKKLERTDQGNRDNRTHERHFTAHLVVTDVDPSVEPAPAPAPASA